MDSDSIKQLENVYDGSKELNSVWGKASVFRLNNDRRWNVEVELKNTKDE